MKGTGEGETAVCTWPIKFTSTGGRDRRSPLDLFPEALNFKVSRSEPKAWRLSTMYGTTAGLKPGLEREGDRDFGDDDGDDDDPDSTTWKVSAWN